MTIYYLGMSLKLALVVLGIMCLIKYLKSK